MSIDMMPIGEGASICFDCPIDVILNRHDVNWRDFNRHGFNRRVHIPNRRGAQPA